MFRNALFVKTICGVTIYSFLLATIPQKAQAWGLPPESFDKMYSLAQKGDVEALRASVYRGLNIDAVNRSGDTGLCVAAKRRDTYTYNAFRASGANPRHPCTQRIVGYDDFVERSSAVPMTANSREAYSALGREKYRVAPWVWWTGGALLVGGAILALTLGGGGGGGHGGGASNEKEAYNSLGAYAGTKAVVMRTTTQNTTNNQLLRHTNSNTNMVSGIDFNYNVLKNAEYLDVVLKANKGATYTNAVDTLLQVGGGTIAMDAMGASKVINDGYIKIDTDNASIGMVASESSSAINNGSGLDSSTQTNGIKMSFSGTEENDTIIGMYADTNSLISNNGEIQGSAILNTGGTATAIAGSMVGMEAMIINEGKDLNTNTINVVNTDSGKIRLTAGDGSAGSEANVAVELVGMGSYLDYYFLNGSQNINRAEQVLLQNYGNIEIDYTGNYTSSSNTALRKGLGGVVGMRADANTNAFNYANIDIKLNDNSSGEAIDVAAGMQSVHGGKITNNNQISITTSDSNSRINYGMLSVEGSGSVSSLYTRLIPILTNSTDATITMEVSNSYGMASFNSGSLINEGNIVLGAEVGTRYTNNIAMYANGIRTPYATLTNTGTIDIYSHKSMAMQNDFGGATPLYNNGTIHVHRDAVDTVVFGGAYSQLINQKDILYGATPNGNLSQTEPSTDVSNPFVNYSPIIGISVMNTKPRTLGNEIASSTSTTERILNDTGANITIYDASFVSGMQVDTAQGIGINKGKITIENRDLEGIDNVTNNVGMYLAADTKDNAYISNSGSIETKTDFAAAMANDSTGNASMLNEKNGTIKSTFKRSIGMYASGRSTLRNGGTIDMQGDENTAIYINGTVDARNEITGIINVGAQSDDENNNSITTGYGFFTTAGAKAKIENKGEINVYTKTRGAGIYTLGQDTIDNMQDINVYTDDTNGIYLGGSANVTNSGTIKVGTAENGVKNSHAIYVAEESTASSVSNSGTIDFYNDTDENAEHGYAIYSEGDADIFNTGVINLHNPKSSAIYASDGTINNNATINILHDDSWALEIADDADITNDSFGIINVGTKEAPVDNSYGILSNEDSTGTITYNGTINVYNKSDKTYGIYANGSVNVDNGKFITAFNDNGTAVYATGNNSITNSGEIAALGADSYAVRSNPELDDQKLTLLNTKYGKLILGNSETSKEGGAAVKAQTIDTVRNNGDILVYNSNAVGIDAQEGTLINNTGNINIYGSGGVAISSGSVDTVKSSGSITLSNGTSTGSVGILAQSGNSIETEGSIAVNGSVGIGINSGTVKGVTNGATITLNNSSGGSTGIKAKSGTSLTNNAGIEIKGKQGVAINSGDVTTVTNSGALNLSNTESSGSVGILAANGTLLDNSEDGTIAISGGREAKAISATATVVTVKNAAPINITTIKDQGYEGETSATGVNVVDTTTLNNSGIITIQSEEGTAINSESAEQKISLTNSGALNLNTTDSGIGIKVNGALKVENKESGAINIGGNFGKGIEVTGTVGTVTNSATINLNNATGGSFGIQAGNGTSLTNSGNITISNLNGTGIQVGSMSSGVLNSATIALPANVNGSKGIEVTTTGNVTNDTGGTITMGSINSSATNNYGIITNSGNITNNGIINMYSSGDAMHSNSTNSTLTNNNNIFLYSGGGYAMYGNSGSTLTNNGSIITVGSSVVAMYTNGSGTFNNNKIINMTGDNNTAMYAANGGVGTFTNSDQITISGNNSYGMRVDETGSVNKITNGGTILLNGTGNYGIYAGSSATKIENNGSITVGNNSKGIWAKDPASVINSSNIRVGDNSHGIHVEISSYDTKVDIVNSGTITIGNNSVAIYVYKDYSLEPQIVDDEPTGKYYRDGTKITDGGASKLVTGSGSGPWEKPDSELVDKTSSNSPASMNDFVWFDDEENNKPQSVSLIRATQEGGANISLINSGTIMSANAIDFGNGETDGSQNILASGGQYVAESFSGTVHVDTSIVADGFETTYVNEDSFVGENNGIEVVSDSYMFDASTAVNDAGNTNVVMSLRPFDDIIEDTDTSEFLAENYTAQRGESLFRVFRTASTQSQFDTAVNQGLGRNIVPNFVKQNLDIERTLNMEIDDEIATATAKEHRASFNAVNFNNKVSGKKNLSGYKDNTTAVYGWLDTRAADLRTRGGLGVVMARSNSKFDDGSKRYNNMAEVFAPITYTQNNTIAMLKLKGGAGYGHYRRQGADKWYKGNTEEYYYGADTALKHTIDVGMFEVTPNVGFNLTGMYMDDIDESNGGLKVKSKNMLSAQSALGVDVAKMFNIDEAQSIKLGAGGKYYHEFGDRYHTSATVSDMVGSYDITDERLERDFGLMTLKAKYQYKQFSIEAEANAPLEQKRNPYYLLNLGYKF